MKPKFDNMLRQPYCFTVTMNLIRLIWHLPSVMLYVWHYLQDLKINKVTTFQANLLHLTCLCLDTHSVGAYVLKGIEHFPNSQSYETQTELMQMKIM